MATILIDIKSNDWQLSLKKLGDVSEDVEDVAQCIKIILQTRKGELPLDPLFGSGVYEFIDKPINVARPGIIKAVFDSISLYEKRVKLDSVIVENVDASLEVSINCTLISKNILLSIKTNF